MTVIKKYSSFTKNATIYGFIIEREGNFGATFGIKIGEFTWCSGTP